MSNPWKHYAVRFAERQCYYIDVQARSPLEAIAKVQDLYDRHGGNPEVGFVFDLSDGGTDEWEAQELQP
jgi:hypothetical protein